MYLNKTRRALTFVLAFAILFSNVFSATTTVQAATPISFTILHTNDFHGQLEASGSNPGMARTAAVVNGIRTTLGEANVLLVDAGDEMQGSLLSNLGDGTATGKGIPTIAAYKAMSYDAATFGNHEFDWGQINLDNRVTQADYPYVTANIVKNDTGSCATAGWGLPDFADAPYEIATVGVAPNTVKVAFIGVTTTEVPTITVSTATAGLCFKDPQASIVHYYAEMKANADVIVVLSHLGYADGGYGYGIPVYGDQTLAKNLNTAGKPVDVIIGGHSHTNLATAGATKVGNTTIVQAYYNGRQVGQANMTFNTATKAVTTTWNANLVSTTGAEDATVKAAINSYAKDPAYLALINQPIGYSAVDLPRSNTTDNMMGAFIDDAIYNYLNSDIDPITNLPLTTNDVDLFFNNAGGLRTDWCYVGGAWTNAGCVAGLHTPGLLTYGNMFTILPFGNATIVGDMTGEQIMEVINYGPNVAGVIQPAGLKYKYYSYKDTNPGPQPFAWGAYDICVKNKTTGACDPIDLKKTYRVGTNEFLAPAGGDGYNAFKYMTTTSITYWGDMLNAVNAYVAFNYGTAATAYKGPNGDGTLDGRIFRDGTDAIGSGTIIPVTVLHHNDMHGNLYKNVISSTTTYAGYTQLATLIKQERLHNPTRTLLLNSGDDIQGDALSFFYKSSYTGKAVDGTALPTSLKTNPVIAVMNSMNYDAMTLGNHEFNFGSDVFKGVMGQANFPVLQANVTDTGAYGLAAANGGAGVKSYVLKNVGSEGIKVAILGIGNHRVPNYELPSNIPGLTFTNPLTKAQELSTALRGTNDVVLALTHIGFTEDPKSVEVDANVDTNLAATVTGLDAIVGGHSHTNPQYGFGNYKFMPTYVVGPNNTTPVIIGHAYRYNYTLGEIVLGMRPKTGGGYEVVTRAGRYLSVITTGSSVTAEDPDTKAIVDPYLTPFATYNDTVVGQTTAPIDTMLAFTQETNGANLQADAAVYELNVKNGIPVDFHLSGAMTNKAIAATATATMPATLKVSDMFAAMPYENSLLVISMNGPQLKTVLERAYRNYYYYKYVPGYGGYSYYTTCMIDTNFGNRITYNDQYPTLPSGNNVVSLYVGGAPVDFTNATKYYNVSTVNYLAAGSCNFNDKGVTLWPLNQIVQDTQFYVRDAVIDYVTFKGIVSPTIEGRIAYAPDTTAPAIVSSACASPNPVNTGSVDFTVTFSESVAGVAANDFSLTKTGSINGEAVLVATPVTAFVYTVTVNTGTGSGDLRLNVPASATVSDLSGNLLTGLPYTTGGTCAVVDTTAPAVATFAAPAMTNALAIPITAFTSLDTDVSGYLITESKIRPLASAAGWTATKPTTYPVTGAGTYTLRPWVKDGVGNVSTVFASPAEVVIDLTAPTIVSSNRTLGDANPTAKQNVNFIVTFSRPVTGVDVTDFTLVPTTITDATITSVTSAIGKVSGKSYIVTVNTGTGNDGDLRLDVKNDGTIKDAVGNLLSGGTFTTGETYTVQKYQTFTSQAANDGWILESTAKSSKGGTVNAGAATFNLGDDKAKKQYLGVLSFDTSALPNNAVITKITLSFKQSGVTGGATFKMFKGLMVDVKNGAFGLPGLQKTDFQAVATSTYGPFFSTTVSTTVDLTSASADINTLGVTQFRLRFKLGDNNNKVANYISFFSGNAAKATDRPTIYLEYYVP